MGVYSVIIFFTSVDVSENGAYMSIPIKWQWSVIKRSTSFVGDTTRKGNKAELAMSQNPKVVAFWILIPKKNPRNLGLISACEIWKVPRIEVSVAWPLNIPIIGFEASSQQNMERFPKMHPSQLSQPSQPSLAAPSFCKISRVSGASSPKTFRSSTCRNRSDGGVIHSGWYIYIYIYK